MSKKINNSEEKYKRMKMYFCHKHLIKGNTYDFDYKKGVKNDPKIKHLK